MVWLVIQNKPIYQNRYVILYTSNSYIVVYGRGYPHKAELIIDCFVQVHQEKRLWITSVIGRNGLSRYIPHNCVDVMAYLDRKHI